MRFTVLSHGEPIGHAEFDAAEIAEGLAVSDLMPLPSFDRVRPLLEHAIRTIHDSSRRAMEASDSGNRTLAGERLGAIIRGRAIPSEKMSERAQHEMRAAEIALQSMEELDLALRDERGTLVPARVSIYVDTRTSEERLGRPLAPPRVDAVFDP